jgi:hypothetical protein
MSGEKCFALKIFETIFNQRGLNTVFNTPFPLVITIDQVRSK